VCPNLDLSEAMLTPSAGPHLLDELVRMCQAYVAGHPLEDPRVSPLLGDLTGLPPLLIQYASGVDVRVERYAADTHVFQMFWSFLPEAADAIGQAGGFLAGLLQASPASPRPSPRQIGTVADWCHAPDAARGGPRHRGSDRLDARGLHERHR
jgi:hypothetical protein